MDQTYYDAVTEMESKQVKRDYMLGWMGGYLHNPMIEEQRLTKDYEAGYADGSSGNKGNFAQWV